MYDIIKELIGIKNLTVTKDMGSFDSDGRSAQFLDTSAQVREYFDNLYIGKSIILIKKRLLFSNLGFSIIQIDKTMVKTAQKIILAKIKGLGESNELTNAYNALEDLKKYDLLISDFKKGSKDLLEEVKDRLREFKIKEDIK